MLLRRIASLVLTAGALALTALSGFETLSATPAVAQPSRLAPLTRSDQVNFRSFHDYLAPYGTWMNSRRWGQVWRPNMGRGFRPYRDGGHWEDTDDYGTTWVSDYDWGDVPFHYGRWVYDPDNGWIWVPGYVWGPAWVIWRAGAGNIGWLPMPPWVAYDGYGDFPDDWSDGYGYADYGLPVDAFDDFWSFVGADDLYAPSISYYVIGPRYYAGFMGRTVGWTRFSIYHGHVFNRSIDRDRFRSVFGHDLREGRRHDFAGRLGPVVDYKTGHDIQVHERALMHTPEFVRSSSGSGTRHTTYEFRSPTSAPAYRSRTTAPLYRSRVTEPTYRSHSVNVYRGGSSSEHTTIRTRTVTPTHTTPGFGSSPYYRSAPTYRPATEQYRSAPSFSGRGAPSGSSSHGAPPHPPSNAGKPH